MGNDTLGNALILSRPKAPLSAGFVFSETSSRFKPPNNTS